MTWPSHLEETMGYSKDEKNHFSCRLHSVSSTACPALWAALNRESAHGELFNRDIQR